MKLKSVKQQRHFKRLFGGRQPADLWAYSHRHHACRFCGSQDLAFVVTIFLTLKDAVEHHPKAIWAQVEAYGKVHTMQTTRGRALAYDRFAVCRGHEKEWKIRIARLKSYFWPWFDEKPKDEPKVFAVSS